MADAGRFALFASLTLAAAALAGCNSPGNQDGGDAVSEAAVEGGADVQADTTVGTDAGTDAAPDAVADAGSDVAPDVSGDAGMCPTGTVAPADYLSTYTLFQNGIGMDLFDGTGIGAGSAVPFVSATIRTPPTTAPMTTMGNCVQFSGPDSTRTSSTRANLGQLRFSQGTLSGTADYDTTMMRYTSDSADMIIGSLVPGMPVALTIPATPGPAAMISMIWPPRATYAGNTFRGNVADPTAPTISRTSDAMNVITWTPVADTDVLMVVSGYDQNDANDTHDFMCAVPACRGSLTIPAAMIAAWPAATVVQLDVGFWRTMPIPPTTRSPAAWYILGNDVGFQPVSQ